MFSTPASIFQAVMYLVHESVYESEAVNILRRDSAIVAFPCKATTSIYYERWHQLCFRVGLIVTARENARQPQRNLRIFLT